MSDRKVPQVGGKFFVSSQDEGEEDQELEIEEICEEPAEDETEDNQIWNVACGGDFYDIAWSPQNSRWEEES